MGSAGTICLNTEKQQQSQFFYFLRLSIKYNVWHVTETWLIQACSNKKWSLKPLPAFSKISFQGTIFLNTSASFWQVKLSKNLENPHFLCQSSSFPPRSLLPSAGRGHHLTARSFRALPATLNLPRHGRCEGRPEPVWGSLCREAQDEQSTKTQQLPSSLELVNKPSEGKGGGRKQGRIFPSFSTLQTSSRSPNHPEQPIFNFQIGQKDLPVHCKHPNTPPSALKCYWYTCNQSKCVGEEQKLHFTLCIHSQDWHQNILGAHRLKR